MYLVCSNRHEYCRRSQADTEIIISKSFYYNSPYYFLLLSSTISRVLYQTIIFLDCTLPHSSSARLPGQNATNPEARRAAVSLPIRSCFGWSLHSLVCYQPSGGLLPRHSTITRQPKVAVKLIRNGFHWKPILELAAPPSGRRLFLFYCTSLGVTSTGRYPAPCPVKPGLSSLSGDRLCCSTVF